MLFTPSPSFFLPSESSSVGSDSSPTHISSASRRSSNANSQSYRNPSSTNNPTLVSNGPTNDRLSFTSQSALSQSSDHEWFYSALSSSSSSSSRPSIQLTPFQNNTDQRNSSSEDASNFLTMSRSDETLVHERLTSIPNPETGTTMNSEEQKMRSLSLSPPVTPRHERNQRRDFSLANERKVILNVGGVRHEGKHIV